MMVPLLFLFAPALAGSASAKVGTSPALHRCTGLLTAPGLELTVQGHGSTPQLAGQRARLAARQAAARSLLGDLWPALLEGDDEAVEARLEGSVVEPILGLPGARYTEQGCAEVPLPAGSRGRTAGWTATVQGVAATRADPGTAASSARRLACDQAWARPMGRVFDQVAVAAGEDRPRMLAEGVSEARRALAACHGQDPVFLAASAPADAPVDGLVECFSQSPGLDEGASGRAWAPTVDAAADLAAWERAINGPLDALGRSFESVAYATAEMKSTLLAASFNLSLSALGSDKLERGLTACFVHPDTGPMAWLPATQDDRECADKADWAGFVSPHRTEPGARRDTWCAEHAARGQGLAEDAIQHASAETKGILRAAAWGVVLRCDVTCRSRTGLQGEGRAVMLPGLAAYDHTVAIELLKAAVEARDLDQAQLIAPALAADRMAALARRDPDAFWDQVGQLVLMLGAGTAPSGMRWVSYGGHAMLMGR